MKGAVAADEDRENLERLLVLKKAGQSPGFEINFALPDAVRITAWRMLNAWTTGPTADSPPSARPALRWIGKLGG